MFRKPAKKRGVQIQARQRQDDDLSGDDDVNVVKGIKRRKRTNAFQQSTLKSTKGSAAVEDSSSDDSDEGNGAVVADDCFEASGSAAPLGPKDQGATATLEVDTDYAADAQAQFERVQQQLKEGLVKDGKTLYKGQAMYGAKEAKDTVKGNASSGLNRIGPIRAPQFLRQTVRWDYAPDICKDYKETGFCTFGDSCKFLHDRSDYKHGWEIERDYASGRLNKVDETNYEINDNEDEFPEDCYICGKPFTSPVVTRCKHYFCETCALNSFRKSKRCQICGENTGGVFNIAKDLIAKLSGTFKKRKAKGSDSELSDEADACCSGHVKEEHHDHEHEHEEAAEESHEHQIKEEPEDSGDEPAGDDGSEHPEDELPNEVKEEEPEADGDDNDGAEIKMEDIEQGDGDDEVDEEDDEYDSDVYRSQTHLDRTRNNEKMSSLQTVNEMQESGGSGSPSEVVYGGTISPTGDEHRNMSEKVQNMASAIYREFEIMIQRYGEDGVKTLMPLVVNVLEALDLAFLEREEQAVDQEMLKEDNEQLVTQYEREKQLRKQAEQKYMEIEDNLIGQNKELEAKIESLESIMRMLELKAKNASDHASRLEEREADQKAEFDRLHERYNALLRTHVDHMERTKYLMGNDKFELMQNMPLPQAQLRTRMGMAASVDASSIRGVSDLISAHMSQSTTMEVNLANHISNEADWQDEFSSDVEPSPRDLASEEEKTATAVAKEKAQKSDKENEQREDEEGDERNDEDSLGADLTGNLVDPAEFASADMEHGDDSPRQRRRRTRSQSFDSENGMGREVENLIKENMELLDMKNALNIVKNDLIARVDELSSENAILRDEVHSFELVRVKMSENITKLEEELKTVKQKLAEKEAEAEEEDVPLAQRKRFTRMEMQRVLIDRNMYKEKLMELEESLKWTEMQRARKLQAQTPPPKKGGIWDFFSGLFGDSSPPTKPRRAGLRADGRVKNQMTRSVEYLDPEMISERRAAERREQYKLVREHVKRDDSGRVEAYGWSLPAVLDMSNSSAMVPVPVCCRPLMENQPSIKVWCATAVTLRGGLDKEGKFITGNPIYFSPSAAKMPKSGDGDDKLENEISRARALDARESELSEWETSSVVWVGSSNQGKSHVAILDANNPNNVIETFRACESHLLCIKGVPGITEGDPTLDDAGAKTFLCGGGKVKDIPDGIEFSELGACDWVELRKMEDSEDGVPTYCSNDMRPSPKRTRDFSVSDTEALTGSVEDVEPEKPSGSRVGRAALPPHVRDAMSKYDESSTVLSTGWPTVWMGSQNQYIYIHSAISSWRKCLRRIKMPDAVLSIIHFKGRVFAALANGTVAVFHRAKGGEWSEFGYHTIRVGPATSSVRCLCVVASNIWAAYKNCIVVIDGENLQIIKVFAAHPRRDSQVRAVQWVGAGVWISIRLDSTLRMYHAHTFEHLQDVDIEPYVTKMLGTSRLDFSYMRTTALLVSNRRLWIGTGTGVVISVPLSDRLEQKVETTDAKKTTNGPGGLVRIVSSSSKEGKDDTSLSSSGGGAFIPYCNLTQAQLSFHGHKDSVKFFLAVPGAPREVEDDQEAELRKMLVISGGDGYIDFRIGEENEPPIITKGVRARDMSHLIIWEVDAELPVVSS
ncbi:hypothetical protein Q1695_014720 [Nippostrongylus brasiliensis]|nr:hypothetical protein Q1695_014720 [Nippostrongylus brasiliensis]